MHLNCPWQLQTIAVILNRGAPLRKGASIISRGREPLRDFKHGKFDQYICQNHYIHLFLELSCIQGSLRPGFFSLKHFAHFLLRHFGH